MAGAEQNPGWSCTWAHQEGGASLCLHTHTWDTWDRAFLSSLSTRQHPSPRLPLFSLAHNLVQARSMDVARYSLQAHHTQREPGVPSWKSLQTQLV